MILEIILPVRVQVKLAGKVDGNMNAAALLD